MTLLVIGFIAAGVIGYWLGKVFARCLFHR